MSGKIFRFSIMIWLLLGNLDYGLNVEIMILGIHDSIASGRHLKNKHGIEGVIDLLSTMAQ